MPTGDAFTPGTGPAHESVRPGGLPESKISRVTLSLSDLHTVSGYQGLDRVAGQFSIARKLRNVKVHVACRFVGVTAINKPANEFDHLWNVFSRPRLARRFFHVQPLCVLKKSLSIVSSNIPGADLLASGHLLDLVRACA